MTPLPPRDSSWNPWDSTGFYSRIRTRGARRCTIVLHRDPEKPLMFVVRTLMELTRSGRAEAMQCMWEAHFWGTSHVMETHLERAELYVELFTDRGLHVSLEPAI